MRTHESDKSPSAEGEGFELPLPEPIVLGTAATKAVAGGIIRPGLCTTCGINQRFSVGPAKF
jgi:hypothetical protein